MLKRERNWWRKARLRPGFAITTDPIEPEPDERRVIRGGVRNSLRWASKVVCLVG